MSNLREAAALIRAEFVQRLLSNSENIGQGFRFVVVHNWLAQLSSLGPRFVGGPNSVNSEQEIEVVTECKMMSVTSRKFNSL